MFSIHTATRVLFAAAVLAVLGTAHAAEKPNLKMAPNSGPSAGQQGVVNSHSSALDLAVFLHSGKSGKPGTAKTYNPKEVGVEKMTRPFADGLALTIAERGKLAGKRRGK